MAVNDWALPSLKEQPFWHDGMTPEEYDAEREYFYSHMAEYQAGEYQPMWKQLQES